MPWKRWPPAEVRECLRLFRRGWSYARIAERLDRNVASVGYVIRREDMAEEARLVAKEEREALR
jgi:hypothetical protein